MVIYRHKDKYSISEMCQFFGVSRSGYYGYVSRMDTPAWDLPLAEKIRECQDVCGKTYGYRRVHIWLERNGIYRTKLQTYEKARLFIGEYIHFYNNQRIQLKTKLTPFEKRSQYIA